VEQKEKNSEQDVINVWDVFPSSEIHAYTDGLTDKEKESYLSYCYNKHYYWLFFLPLPRHSRILVIDDSPGLASLLLVFMGHNVVSVRENKKSRFFSKQEMYEKNGGTYQEKFSDIATILKSNEAKYDVIIINDLLQISDLVSGKGKDIANIFEKLTAISKEEALLWIGGKNPNCYRDIFRGKGNKQRDNKIWSILESTLLRKGAKIKELHELSPSYSMPEKVEFLLPKREKTNEKPSGVRDLIRTLLPQSVRKKFLSPAYGILFAFSDKYGATSFVEELVIELLGSDGILKKIYLGNPDTLILKLANREQNIIARIPFTKEANNRCIRSQQTLEELGWFKYDDVRLVPSAEGKLVLNGLHIYTESAILGESIGDVSCRDVQHIDNAIDIITRLHLATVANTIVSEEVYNELIGTLIRKLKKNLHPSFAERIQWLAAYFKQSFLNKSIPLVFNHGDYKLENILVKKEDCSLVGVIDWDLSVENGMPLVDIIHLLAYEKHAESNLPIDEVIMGHWVPGQQSLEKKDCILVDQYM